VCQCFTGIRFGVSVLLPPVHALTIGIRPTCWRVGYLQCAELSAPAVYMPSLRLIRPPDIPCRRTYILPGFFFFFFFAAVPNLRDRWTELNQNQAHARKWLRFKNACPKCGVSPFLTNWGPKHYLLGPISQLNGNFNARYLRNETAI